MNKLHDFIDLELSDYTVKFCIEMLKKYTEAGDLKMISHYTVMLEKHYLLLINRGLYVA